MRSLHSFKKAIGRWNIGAYLLNVFPPDRPKDGWGGIVLYNDP